MVNVIKPGLFLILFILTCSCRKDKGKLLVEKEDKLTTNDEIPETKCFNAYAPVWACETVTYNNEPLPPEPPLTGWLYQTVYGKLSVVKVFPDVLNETTIFYLTNESNTANYTLWRYNWQTREKKWIANGIKDLTINSQSGELLILGMNDVLYRSNNDGSNLQILDFSAAGIANVEFYWMDDGKRIYSNGEIYNQNNQLIDTVSRGIYKGDYFYYYKDLQTDPKYYRKNIKTNEEILVFNEDRFKKLNPIRPGWFFNYFQFNCDQSVIYFQTYAGFCKINVASGNMSVVFKEGTQRGSTNGFSKSIINGHYFGVKGYVFNIIAGQTMVYHNEVYEFTEDFKCRRKIELPD
jgi:hypothetical protein